MKGHGKPLYFDFTKFEIKRPVIKISKMRQVSCETKRFAVSQSLILMSSSRKVTEYYK